VIRFATVPVRFTTDQSIIVMDFRGGTMTLGIDARDLNGRNQRTTAEPSALLAKWLSPVEKHRRADRRERAPNSPIG
jgi:hypothetical protein